MGGLKNMDYNQNSHTSTKNAKGALNGISYGVCEANDQLHISLFFSSLNKSNKGSYRLSVAEPEPSMTVPITPLFAVQVDKTPKEIAA
jgi:hypothetical protein